MRKITKVPNGPLVKKKGPYAGSTLKTGGTIKKAQTGVSMAKRDSIKAANKARIDSTNTARAKKFGFDNKEDYFEWQEKRRKGPDQDLPGKEGCGNKKGGSCGAATSLQKSLNKGKNGSSVKKAQGGGIFKNNPIYKMTTDLRGKIGGAALGIPGIKPIAKNGDMIKRADGSKSKRGLWDNIRANKGSGKKPTKQMLVQEKKIKAKSKK